MSGRHRNGSHSAPLVRGSNQPVPDLLRTCAAPLFVTDSEDRVVAASTTAERLFHHPRGGVDGLPLAALGPFAEATRSRSWHSGAVVHCRTRDGEPFRARLHVLDIREGPGFHRAWLFEPLSRIAPPLQQRFQSTLLKISRAPEFIGGDFRTAARVIARSVTEALEIERVSVWLLSDDGNRLECTALYERTPARMTSGTVLDAKDYPRYFEALAEGRAIAAGDASTDPRTSEFANGYLDVLGIGAMLDSVIRVAGEVVGVVCHEHVGAPRAWREEEVVFSAEVADQAAHALLNSRHREAEAESRRLERELNQSRKLEAIGRLASGVAHDFNNLLTVIQGYADLGESSDSVEETAESLQEIRRAVDRAGALTSQLLAIGRRQVLRPKHVHLNEVVQGMQDMLRRLIPEDIELEFELRASQSAVLADTRQLEQILINLCVNARDATRSGGHIEVGTECLEIDGSNVVVLTVTDDGEGIPLDLQEEIFEPFYTSKPEGLGTGLGLSMIYGIAKQHGGRVEVDSVPGRGSRFEVHLPAIGAPESNGSPDPELDATALTTSAPHGHSASSRNGRARVLLAEDASQLRAIVRRMLERGGYEVLEARDGEEALQLFRADPGAVDLVVLDAIMPRLGGLEAFDAIRALDQRIPIVLTTGYGDEISRAPAPEGAPVVLAKPFETDDLLRVVRAEIGSPSSNGS